MVLGSFFALAASRAVIALGEASRVALPFTEVEAALFDFTVVLDMLLYLIKMIVVV
jgi:hypothetical protein